MKYYERLKEANYLDVYKKKKRKNCLVENIVFYTHWLEKYLNHMVN